MSLSRTFLCQSVRLPWVMVGERAVRRGERKGGGGKEEG